MRLGVTKILDKGFNILMDGKCVEDLQRIYTLFSKITALETLTQSLYDYISKTGSIVALNEEADNDMVSNL